MPKCRTSADAESLYNTLEKEIIPLYYGDRDANDVPVKWMRRVKDPCVPSPRSSAPGAC